MSKEDLDYYNLTSIPFADGSGYAAELGVHHELHCLKKIRHWIYKDYYLTNETKAAMIEWPAHIRMSLPLPLIPPNLPNPFLILVCYHN